jgi:hypothetical protein
MRTVSVLLLGDVAQHFSDKYGIKLAAWQIRRLFTLGLLEPAHRLGPNRVINPRDLPKIEKALKKAGYLPEEVTAE